ncbi:MAG: sugar phosphate isomerase/epimerase [Spirochaetales bacterium]|jgi:sugar phosphate isomerase/epimerase|nr:sugar phosphate isomerase/epimerase [Spirochaetales bacterium]
MRYGFCKEFSTALKTEVDYSLVKMIKDAGFDYIEMRLMLVAALADDAFEKLVRTLNEYALPCDVCCALFPRTLRVTGMEADDKAIGDYLELAFCRANKLGARKVVFGSAPARALDENTTQERGYQQLTDMIHAVMLPLCEKYDITVVIEPLRRDACNFINTLTDGMKLVKMVHSNRIGLLADSLHMLTNQENANQIMDYQDSLRHVHIADAGRNLPEDGYSTQVEAIIRNLRKINYNHTISFESKNGRGVESMVKALDLLKRQFN